MTEDEARKAASGVGLVTALIGGVLVASPDRFGRVARLEDVTGLRAIGVADLALVPGLLAADSRRPWMLARAGLNLLIAGFLLRRPVDKDTTKRRVISVALGLLTLQDLRVARALGDRA
ncbi:MAG: hypothetical protein Q7T55_02700 [Solirubrobacteraceae bacterium]|nr:hypothetical protein [Solirubrobacteraceae bacterium]